MTSTYTKRVNYFTESVYKPFIHWLDNETVPGTTSYDKDNSIDIQLTPPNVHRTNDAERAIRTQKDHFLAGLSSTHPLFPLTLWDKLIPQTNMTLNMLRKSRVNPKLTAYEEFEGTFNFNSTPIFPPG